MGKNGNLNGCLFAFNARTCHAMHVGRRCGVIVMFKAGVYRTPLHQARAEHPDKHKFRWVPFLPVWVPEIFPVWERWQCLHTEGQFNLGVFDIPEQRIDWKNKVLVSVAKVAAVYNPFQLAWWLWGCAPFGPAEVLKAKPHTGQHAHHGTTQEFEVGRIKYLVEHVADDPIIICTDYHLFGTEIMIEEGNHRFAAAIVRRDRYISAVWVGDFTKVMGYLW